ncbi:outer membrane lipoprotein-sorting protein [Sporosarcina luteola]|nr:outer membrane lipoprotein-sorting protein [Sporosarcina luteola]
MNWMKKTVSISAMLFFAAGLAACSSEDNQFSPQEVINEALKEANEPLEYYGEYVIKSDEEDNIQTLEWVSSEGKRRIEMKSSDGDEMVTAVNDGKKLSLYDKASNTAMITEFNEEEMRPIIQRSPRQQAQELLDMVQDTHDFSVGKEEKIAGRDTYHIIAAAKDDKTLFGNIEMWVDKETWMVLKSISEGNGFTMKQEYTKIDYKPEITDDLFVLDIPEDATIETMDVESMMPKETTQEAVKKELGAFYQIPETEDLKLSQITVTEGFEGRQEFSFDYTLQDIPVFSVSVFKAMSDVTEFDGMPNEEKINIRGLEGIKTDSKGFRLVEWKENELQYNVLLEDNPEIGFEEVEAYLEGMELVE